MLDSSREGFSNCVQRDTVIDSFSDFAALSDFYCRRQVPFYFRPEDAQAAKLEAAVFIVPYRIRISRIIVIIQAALLSDRYPGWWRGRLIPFVWGNSDDRRVSAHHVAPSLKHIWHYRCVCALLVILVVRVISNPNIVAVPNVYIVVPLQTANVYKILSLALSDNYGFLEMLRAKINSDMYRATSRVKIFN